MPSHRLVVLNVAPYKLFSHWLPPNIINNNNVHYCSGFIVFIKVSLFVWMFIIEYVLMSNFCIGVQYSVFIRLGLSGLERIRPFTCKSFFCIRINHLTNAVPERIKFVS